MIAISATKASVGMLDESLRRLATCLQTPVVAGELEPWLAAVSEATVAGGTELRRQVATEHPAEYAQIVKEDPELFRHVEQMKDGDRMSLELFDAFARRIEQMNNAAPRFEPDELRLEDRTRAVIDEGLALVMHIQKQEVARRTWLQEAFNRERGVGD